MNRAEQRFEQIEQYLRRQMSPEAAAAFEAEMAADPGLAEQVQQHRLERQGLELLVERDLLAQMQAWDRETALLQSAAPPRRASGPSPLRVLFRAAAIAAVFVTAFFGWWLLRDSGAGDATDAPPVAEAPAKDKKKSPAIRKPAPAKPGALKTGPQREETVQDEMAAQEERPRQTETPAPIDELPPSAASADYAALAGEFYRENDFIPPKGSKGGGTSSSYNQALDSYRDGRLGNVITQLKPGLDQGADALQRRELLAHTYYKNGQYDAASEEFRAIIATRKSPYAQRAEWALVLTLLHQMPAKKPLLDRVLGNITANPGHPFYGQAQALKARGL